MDNKGSSLFDVKELQKCQTKEEVEKYFEQVDITSYKEKIEALTKATRSSQIDYFYGDYSEELQYKTLLIMFLNKEFRFQRGIF